VASHLAGDHVRDRTQAVCATCIDSSLGREQCVAALGETCDDLSNALGIVRAGRVETILEHARQDERCRLIAWSQGVRLPTG
jgi:hypothetical protein